MSLGKRKINSKASKDPKAKEDKPILLQATRCNSDVYNNGQTIAVINSIGKERTELIVRLAARKSGQKIDWFYMAGRAVVRCIGDPYKALDALQKQLHSLKPVYYQIYLENLCPGCHEVLDYDEDLSGYLICRNFTCASAGYSHTREKWEEIEKEIQLQNLQVNSND